MSSFLFVVLVRGSLLIALAALACVLARRRSAALRHGIWCAVLVAVAALPILEPPIPAWRIPLESPAAPVMSYWVWRPRRPAPSSTSETGFLRSRLQLHVPGKLTARERYASSVLFLFMLMVPWLLLIWPPVAGYLQVWWVDALVRAGVIVLTALVTGAILARTKTFHGAITPAPFADAFVRLGIGWSLFGILVLVTGRVPSRYVHRSIPRMALLTYFAIGTLLCLVAAVCAKFRKPDTHRGTSSA